MLHFRIGVPICCELRRSFWSIRRRMIAHVGAKYSAVSRNGHCATVAYLCRAFCTNKQGISAQNSHEKCIWSLVSDKVQFCFAESCSVGLGNQWGYMLFFLLGLLPISCTIAQKLFCTYFGPIRKSSFWFYFWMILYQWVEQNWQGAYVASR